MFASECRWKDPNTEGTSYDNPRSGPEFTDSFLSSSWSDLQWVSLEKYSVNQEGLGRIVKLTFPCKFNKPSMLGLLRHQTRFSFVRNSVRFLRGYIHASIAAENSNTVIKRTPFLKRSLVSRSFHSAPICYSSCDFGGPCNCSECMQDQWKPICEVCKARPTVHQSSEYSIDRKGLGGYIFTSLCEECRQENETARRESEERERQIFARHVASVARMLDNVQQIQPVEQVPIAYAVDKFMTEIQPKHEYHPSHRITAKMKDEARKLRLTEQISFLAAFERYRSQVGHKRSLQRFRGKFQRRIIDGLSKELQIVKIRNKYMCNKQRVDAVDFKLWFSRGPADMN